MPKPKPKEPQFKRAQTQVAGAKVQTMKTVTTEKANKTRNNSNSSDNFSIDEELLKDTDSDSGIYDNYGRAKKDKLNLLAYGTDKNYMSLKVKNCSKNP